MAAAGTTVTIDGHRISLTNSDKVMYPSTGTTKADVIAYYRAAAPWLVAHTARRPATRKRWVDGVGTPESPGKAFFSKDLDSGTPSWVPTLTLTHQHREATYPTVDTEATLVWLAQIAALEIHVPQWRAGPRGGHRNPDRLVFDLDPGDGAGLPECVAVALLCKEILDGMGLVSVPVTSGSKGIHVYAALDGSTTTSQAGAVARELARALAADHRDLIVSDMLRALRPGKVFIDWSQNNGNKTTVAPYSLRGRSTPYVAAPRRWEELTNDVGQLLHTEVMERLRTVGDPMSVLLTATGDEAGGGERHTGSGAAPGGPGDRLATYRSMRDGDKTPEPVPAGAPEPSSGTSFVIQEHHARALHHDFRLERDGVLVSWALPKGPPTDPRKNHLAVMTEDHPLSYGSFEGTIPKGQYGGGEVSIWDAGTYELEKWIDGKEVIATLHGRPGGGLGGSARFALIHTGRGGNDRQWLIHRMALPDNDSHAIDVVADTEPATASPLEPLPKIAPMLATPGSVADVTSGDWVFETKWDGYRAIAEIAAGTVVFRSRNGNDLSRAYPELQELSDLLPGRGAIVDGEIVALDARGRTNFGALQNRGNAAGILAHYMVFDLLHIDGRSLLNRPYRERREALEALGLDGRHVHVPVTFGSDRDLAVRTSRDLHLEGLIAKTVDGIYQPGARDRTWVKIKNLLTQEVVVVGWKPGAGSREGRVGSLLLAIHGDQGLSYAGKVGTGFTEAALTEIGATLVRIECATPPLTDVPRLDARDAHWVTPSLVGEVAFTEWTDAGKIRHPTWRGWRPDKEPGQVRRD